jgi:ketosteroid isomerase-like protein
MSEGNVEIVREAVAALGRAFESYFRAPRSIAEATESGDWPEWNEAVGYVHPEIEWQTVFLGTTVHGRGASARLWDDYLQWASDYRPILEEIEDLGGDRVFAVLSLTGRDKTTGREMTSRFYDIFTIRDGMIARLEEYTSRREALGDNAENLRAFWKAWNPGGDMDLSLLDSEVEYEDSNLPDHAGEIYRGHEGVARATERWLEPYESMTIELERIAGSGDRLVSIHRARARARYTGIDEEGPLAYVWTFRDGKVIYFGRTVTPAKPSPSSRRVRA